MIEVQDVSRFYGARPAVRGVSFQIEDGECVGLLGPNGAGKSTTLRMLCGLSAPSMGSVRINGELLTPDAHSARRHIGFLSEPPPLYPEMTVTEYLLFVAKLRGMGGSELRRLKDVLEICDLGRVAQQTIGTLSHGYRQRVGLAQAIIHDPKVLVLDEPSQGLDPVHKVQMRRLIQRLRGEHTIVLSTHLLAEITECCDRILMIDEGALCAEGSEEELRDYYGGGLVRLVLLVDGDGDKLESLLQEGEGVHGCELTREGEHWRVRMSLERDDRALLSRGVIEAGFELLELRRADSALEDLFMRLSKLPEEPKP